MDFSLEKRKELIKEFKVKAIVEKLKAEAIEKEIQDNKSNYTDEELEIFGKLLQEANRDYDKYQETYVKGSLVFGVEELKQRYK